MPRDQLINQSKQAFVQALLRLLETESFTDITIKQLVLESGYSRRTYYRYFHDKDAILDTLFTQRLQAYHDRLSHIDLAPAQLPAQIIAALWPHHQELQLLAQRDVLVPLMTRHLETIIKSLLTIDVPWRQSTTQNTTNYRYALTYSIGGFTILLNTLFTQPKTSITPEQLTTQLTMALSEIVTQWQLQNDHAATNNNQR